MVSTMILKENYRPFTKISPNAIKVMFNYKEVDSGDESKAAQDYCTVTVHIFYGSCTSTFIAKALQDAVGIVNLEEAYNILKNITEDPSEDIKQLLLNNITLYDESSEVRQFYVNGSKHWLNKDLRASICRSLLPAEESRGKESTILWLDGEGYDLPLPVIKDMLNKIECYAKDCLDITNSHKKRVSMLSNIQHLISYDFKSNYPKILQF